MCAVFSSTSSVCIALLVTSSEQNAPRIGAGVEEFFCAFRTNSPLF